MHDLLHREFIAFSQFLSDIDKNQIETYKTAFFQHIDRIASLIDQYPDPETARNEFFKLCSTIEESPLHARTRSKPLGYAGDFLLIDWIYTQKVSGSSRGQFFDQMFHLYDAAVAVRNRKAFFISKCKALAASKLDRIEILDIGCGSCRDIVEAHSVCDNGTQFYYHCVDNEKKAVDYAEQLLEDAGISNRVTLECRNAFQLHSVKQYDLIWCAGLFDYLSDRTASLLIKKLWRNIKTGGEFVFGNFSPENTTRTGMELIGQWYLIHRNSHQLLKICEKAGVDYSSLRVESEPLGVNLFCIITK